MVAQISICNFPRGAPAVFLPSAYFVFASSANSAVKFLVHSSAPHLNQSIIGGCFFISAQLQCTKISAQLQCTELVFAQLQCTRIFAQLQCTESIFAHLQCTELTLCSIIHTPAARLVTTVNNPQTAKTIICSKLLKPVCH